MMRSRIPSPVVLRSVIDVVETASLTRSAERLNLTQSAVGHHIAQFERSIGAGLFERGERAIRPTAQATALAKRLDRTLAELDAILDEARRAGPNRVVRLAAPPELIRYWLARRLDDARQAQPWLDVVLVPEIRRDALSGGDVDLQIRLGWPSGTEEGFALADDDEIVVCAPKLAETLPARQAFAATPFLVAAQAAHTRLDRKRWLGELFGSADLRAGVARPSHVRTCPSFDAMMDACRNGDGFALVRTRLVADDIATGRFGRSDRGAPARRDAPQRRPDPVSGAGRCRASSGRMAARGGGRQLRRPCVRSRSIAKPAPSRIL